MNLKTYLQRRIDALLGLKPGFAAAHFRRYNTNNLDLVHYWEKWLNVGVEFVQPDITGPQQSFPDASVKLDSTKNYERFPWRTRYHGVWEIKFRNNVTVLVFWGDINNKNSPAPLVLYHKEHRSPLSDRGAEVLVSSVIRDTVLRHTPTPANMNLAFALEATRS